MKIGIIAAMHQECEFFRELIEAPVHSRYLDIKITHGQYAGHPVCLLESGIGKVNATIAIEWIIREFAADLIINTGSAGGIKAGVAVGDFVFAEKVCHHDVDVSPIGFKYGELPRLPIYYPIKTKWLERLDQLAKSLGDKHHIGTIATGESFIYQNPQVEVIKQRFPDVLACEMEAAAVAQVCHLHDMDYLVIRNLSDIAGQDAQINFNQYIQQAGQKSTELVLALIDSINSN